MYCFIKNAFLVGIFILFLYIFDLAWVLLPNFSSGITLIVTIGLLFFAFKLATVVTNFLFTTFFARYAGCSITPQPSKEDHLP